MSAAIGTTRRWRRLRIIVESSVTAELPSERLDASEGETRRGRELCQDRATGCDSSATEDDGHDTGSRDLSVFGVWGERSGHQARMEAVHLSAGGAQAGQLEDRGGAEVETGGGGQAQKIDAGGGDVLAEVAGLEMETEGAEVCEEGGLQEMNLGEVGLPRVSPSLIPVPDGGAAVSVSVDAQAGEEFDLWLRVLAEGVGGAEAHGDDFGPHQRGLSVRE